MPSTLLGTLHMRDFGTGIADKADEVPLYWKNTVSKISEIYQMYTPPPLTTHGKIFRSIVQLNTA